MRQTDGQREKRERGREITETEREERKGRGRHSRREDRMNKQSFFSTSGICISS